MEVSGQLHAPNEMRKYIKQNLDEGHTTGYFVGQLTVQLESLETRDIYSIHTFRNGMDP
jgi:hypothetical protein